ncbi:MAG: heparinase II/III family protein [Mariniphaga sp.]|nr:heparinase II/III family protein [Mariniphaga sp.]
MKELSLRRINYFMFLTHRYMQDKLRHNPKMCLDNNYIIKWKKHIKDIAHLRKTINTVHKTNEDLNYVNNVMNHEFYLFGQLYKYNDLDGQDQSSYYPINWQKDPASGFIFSKNVWYRTIRKHIPDGVDIKYPWELSRCQHLVLLGVAYQHTGDKKYVKEYMNQIEDWIESNPVRFGPNWNCTMEVAIRAANWLIALLYFIKSPELKMEFLSKLLISIQEHGKHIQNNLENLQPYTSNHYAANIAGLFILSIFLPESKQSNRWNIFSLKELEKEINAQTLDSGWQYESSTAYHRLVAEMFLYPYIFGKSLGISFSDTYIIKLRKTINILESVAKPGGIIPQIGDNDSGRFLVFNLDQKYDDLCINYILETANRHTELVTASNQPAYRFYKDAGRFIWKNEKMDFLFVAGPKGQGGNGGHAHNDVLSYELNISGQDIFIDPGTFTYTREPEMRNYFRSVKSHNTLYWENIEPCSLEKGLFSLREEGELKINTEKIEESIQKVTGLYRYQGRFHKRFVTVDQPNNKITVIDNCSHKSGALSFILYPGLEFHIENDTIFMDQVRVEFNGVSAFQVESGFYSSGYGKITETNIIRAKLEGLSCAHTIYY